MSNFSGNNKQIIVCPNCGNRVESNDNFCIECGYNLHGSGKCPSCGGNVQSGDNFCMNCGNKL